MTDHAHRLAGLGKFAHEAKGVLVHAHRVRIADAARNNEPVVRVGSHIADRSVDVERVRFFVVVEALDLARLERDELRLPARRGYGVPRLGELDLLDHVGRQEGDLLSVQVRHVT